MLIPDMTITQLENYVVACQVNLYKYFRRMSQSLLVWLIKRLTAFAQESLPLVYSLAQSEELSYATMINKFPVEEKFFSVKKNFQLKSFRP